MSSNVANRVTVTCTFSKVTVSTILRNTVQMLFWCYMKSLRGRLINKKDKGSQCESCMFCIYIYIYIYICVCVCLCMCVHIQWCLFVCGLAEGCECVHGCVCKGGISVYLWACLCVITVLACWIIQCPPPSVNTDTNWGEPLKIHEEIITGRCPALSPAAAPSTSLGRLPLQTVGSNPLNMSSLSRPGAATGAGGQRLAKQRHDPQH